ncbi:MAG TPA: DUF6508 domain-containing protein [Bacteroidales bacterium]|nr:hypothetical protein [Bacteroidales bacterium]HNR41480.1 DUF6508 domain-containing protein [Bacteroidales bacterium]HPM19382.1 DUF6508 domain-containing protein [Bacteroidales bacterium]
MKVLKDDNYREKINSYTKQDWKPLFDLIPLIEQTDKFGDDTEAMKSLEKGIFIMDPYEEHHVVEQFREAVYAIPVMIDFDWSAWDEGRKIVSDDNFDYDSIDIPTKCKIISAIVRNDRFCSGRLVSAFETGMMLKVLRSIQRQAEPGEPAK